MTGRNVPFHRVLRMTLWQRAKGLLLAILETFWTGETTEFERVEAKFGAFIADIEESTCLG